MATSSSKRTNHVEGQIVRIDLGDGTSAYARVLKKPLFAFYDSLHKESEEPSIDEIVANPVAFKIWVMDYAITKNVWSVIGQTPLTEDLEQSPDFFKQDMIDGKVSIYNSDVVELAPSYERPATYDECLGLERAAVWDPHHVEDRLRDDFAGRACKWVEPVRTAKEFRAWREELRRKREARTQSK